MLLGEEGQRKLRLRNLTNDSLFELWDSELIIRYRTPKTLYEARRLSRHFRDFLGQFPPSPELGKQFLSQFAQRKPGTFYRYTVLMKVFFQWYGSPLDMKVRMPKQLPAYVDDADIDKVIEAIKSKHNFKGTIARDILIVEVGRSTGLRREELANLLVRDIHLDQGVLVVREGKGNKDATIPLTQAINSQLAGYISSNGLTPDSKLFGGLKPSTISDKIHKFAKKAGVDIHCHSLRHAFGTRLIERGANPEAVRQLMRHESLAVTQKYISLGGKGLREAISLLDDHHKPESKPGRGMPWSAEGHKFSWELPEYQSIADKAKKGK
jgi:integrase/recombinase XerD